MLLKATWIPGEGCAIIHTDNTVLAATFIYSMCFDALVMSLSAVKLYKRTKGSQLVSMLFKDGLIYFLVAWVSSALAPSWLLTVFQVHREFDRDHLHGARPQLDHEHRL